MNSFVPNKENRTPVERPMWTRVIKGLFPSASLTPALAIVMLGAAKQSAVRDVVSPISETVSEGLVNILNCSMEWFAPLHSVLPAEIGMWNALAPADVLATIFSVSVLWGFGSLLVRIVFDDSGEKQLRDVASWMQRKISR